MKLSPLHRSHSTPSPTRPTFERTESAEGSGVFLRVHNPARIQSRGHASNGSSDAQEPAGVDYVNQQALRDPKPASNAVIRCQTPLDPISTLPSSANNSHLGVTVLEEHRINPSPTGHLTDSAKTPTSTTKHPPNSDSAAPEISIARQISITRRQRQQLLPVHIDSDSERLINRQPMTPTLVNVKSVTGSGRAIGEGHMSRKSQRGIIESA